MISFKIRGLCTATHTPFDAEGELNLAVVEKQAIHLATRGVKSAFIGGTTGESHSVTLAERKALAERWMQVTKANNLDLPVIVHVGSNCLHDSADLSAHAQKIGAAATSMFAPSYFKPANVDLLVECCAKVAKASPNLPFYYYDIPSLTGVSLPAEEFLTKAQGKIPNLNGIKFTNPDYLQFQLCHRFEGGKFDIPYGNDEYMLGAVAMGAKGAVGSTFNFCPGIYNRLMAAVAKGDNQTAADELYRSCQVVKIVAKRGYMGCAKALMGHLGVPVGPARLPNRTPSADEVKAMIGELEAIGFFSWKD